MPLLDIKEQDMYTEKRQRLLRLIRGCCSEAERLSIPAEGGESCCWVEADFSSDRSSRATVCTIFWMASFEVLCPLESSVVFCFSAIAQKRNKLLAEGTRSEEKFCGREAGDTTAGRRLLWCRTRIHLAQAQSAMYALALRMRITFC